MCYTGRKLQGGVGAQRESGDINFLKPNDQSRNLNVYGVKIWLVIRSVTAKLYWLITFKTPYIYIIFVLK